MDRRLFLKITGLVAAASALDVLPAAAEGASRSSAAEQPRQLAGASRTVVRQLSVREPGTYLVSGLVRLEEPLVEISGLTNAQRISRSQRGGAALPVIAFTSYEQFDRPGLTPPIRVSGGSLEALTLVPVVLE